MRLKLCLLRGSAKTEEALELMKSAANQYKMGKNWREAGNTFRRIGTHHARVGGNNHRG